jgi:hypothetical protein
MWARKSERAPDGVPLVLRRAIIDILLQAYTVQLRRNLSAQENIYSVTEKAGVCHDHL